MTHPDSTAPAPRTPLHPVTYPGLQTFHLTPEQHAVVRELLDAMLHRASPEVGAADLLLAALFAGSPAWGELVVRGRKRGRYRLAEPVAG